MRDSNSEIISEKNVFYPQISGRPNNEPFYEEQHDPRKENKARQDLANRVMWWKIPIQKYLWQWTHSIRKPFAIPSMNNNPRKRNKARQDLDMNSCDVMRDSNSEITFEMNAFYPQISRPSLWEEPGAGRNIFPNRKMGTATIVEDLSPLTSELSLVSREPPRTISSWEGNENSQHRGRTG